MPGFTQCVTALSNQTTSRQQTNRTAAAAPAPRAQPAGPPALPFCACALTPPASSGPPSPSGTVSASSSSAGPRARSAQALLQLAMMHQQQIQSADLDCLVLASQLASARHELLVELIEPAQRTQRRFLDMCNEAIAVQARLTVLGTPSRARRLAAPAANAKMSAQGLKARTCSAFKRQACD